MLALEVRGRTDVGRRSNNEDAWFASPRVVAVADGVGGAGETPNTRRVPWTTAIALATVAE